MTSVVMIYFCGNEPPVIKSFRNYSALSDQEKKRLSSPSAAIGDPVFLSSKLWIPAKILPE